MRNILILKFPYSSLYGGGEKHTVELVENLQKKGFNFYYAGSCPVLLAEFIKRNWPAKKAWGGIEPVSAWALALFFFTWPFVLINLLILLLTYKVKYKINAVFCLSLTEKILLTAPARLLGVKVVWMEHKLIGNWLLKSPLKYLFNVLSKFALVITVSDCAKKSLTELGVHERNIKVIYNGIDLNIYKQHPSQPENLKKEFRVGFIGRLAAEKGIKYLILAISKLKNVLPQIKLIVIGEGPDKKSLQMLIIDKGIKDKVLFVGFQQNANKWLANFDCLVVPSVKDESFGLAAAEALACEKPVIYSDISGLKEVMDNYGYPVEPHHSTNIADALMEIYNNYLSALLKAQNGRKHVEAKYSLDKMIENYGKILENYS